MSPVPVAVAGAKLVAAELTSRFLVPKLIERIERIMSRSSRARDQFSERAGTSPEAYFFGADDPADASRTAAEQLRGRDDLVVLGAEQFGPLLAEAQRRFREHRQSVHTGIDEVLDREESAFLDDCRRQFLGAATEQVASRGASAVVNVSGTDPEQVAQIVERFVAQGYRVDVRIESEAQAAAAREGVDRGRVREHGAQEVDPTSPGAGRTGHEEQASGQSGDRSSDAVEPQVRGRSERDGTAADREAEEAANPERVGDPARPEWANEPHERSANKQGRSSSAKEPAAKTTVPETTVPETRAPNGTAAEESTAKTSTATKRTATKSTATKRTATKSTATKKAATTTTPRAQRGAESDGASPKAATSSARDGSSRSTRSSSARTRRSTSRSGSGEREGSAASRSDSAAPRSRTAGATGSKRSAAESKATGAKASPGAARTSARTVAERSRTERAAPSSSTATKRATATRSPASATRATETPALQR